MKPAASPARTRFLLLPAALALLLHPGAAGGSEPALAALNSTWGAHEAWFSNPRLGSTGHLRVTAGEDFLLARTPDRTQALEELAAAWAKALEKSGAARPDPSLVEVRWSHGGWLWRSVRSGSGKEKLRLVDRWDDSAFPWLQEAAQKDKWFFFAGGQSMSGGDIGSSSGVNLRVGTTLFRERYDVAFTFNKTSTGPAPKVKANAYGVMGRALFRNPNNWGTNVGGQVTAITASGARTETQVSALLGLNYYVPKGSWDMTLNLGDEGTRTLIFGYTVYLTR